MPAADQDDVPVTGNGLVARLRQRPERVRTAAFGTIVVGLGLFLVASLAQAVEAPDHRSVAHAAAPARPAARPVLTAPPDALPPHHTPIQSADTKLLRSKPRHVKKQAPATKAVVSGLAANGIPTVALMAYRTAAAWLAAADPACGIDWALLAAIGREESDHGRFSGAVLHADGTSTPRIIGIPLTGHGTARVLDSDRGRIDGDAVYDRAAGPMQFIPTTWAAYGTDATGDGRADIFNINDAALTAARYLCGAGGNLRTHRGQVAAVLAYNHSDEYLAQVLALARAYRTGVPLRRAPVGKVNGTLPPVLGAPGYPPVNPGPPTAADRRLAKQRAAQRAAAAKAAREAAASKHTSPIPTTTTPAGPAPTHTSQRPTGSATPTPTPSPSPSLPVPTRTTTCLLRDLFNPDRCVLYL